ncbi:MAG: hypothetical protein NT107_00025 [Planctomycetota bacterium]|nr:hypothetical protein [Planctomycetota bacterium]
MRLVFPNFKDEDATGGDTEKLLDEVNTVNKMNKAVKLYVQSDKSKVSAALEFFVAAQDQPPSQEHINAIIERSFDAMKAGILNARDQIKNKNDSM